MTHSRRSRHAQAVRWWLRSQDGPLSAAEQQALDRWLARDPAHGEALAAVEKQWALAGELAHRPPHQRHQPAARRATMAPWLAAATVLLAVLLWRGPHWWLQARADRITGAAVETLTLDDGSRVTLAGHSALRLDYDQNHRAVTLLRGQAVFHPAPVNAGEPRPFTVQAGDARLTALGTVFWVRRLDAHEQRVAVLEHRVLARLPGHPEQRLATGQSARLSDRAGIRLLALDPTRATDWSRGVLVFDGEPLSDALARINPFRQRPLVLLDRARAGTPVRAVLHLDNLDGGVPALADSLGLRTLEVPGLTLLY
ncbi:FecR family protein [Alloalcanivorax gelatiniphagus]|nr:FecR domain-containing protein [Alloalcanivorax gelatiniphagus]